MTRLPSTVSIFSRTERYGLALLCLVFILATFFLGHQTNGAATEQRLSDSTTAVSNALRNRLNEVRTVTSSLVGMHHATNNTDGGRLRDYAASLQKDAPFISAIGRYKPISNEDRWDFEDSMSGAGLFNFQIGKINEDGRRRNREEAESYIPISMLEPMAVKNLLLLGTDLALVPGLTQALDDVILSNEAYVSRFPSHWPLADQLVLFQPVYRGNTVPSTEQERSEQQEGGFIIVINLVELLDTLREEWQDYNFSIELRSPTNDVMVFNHTASSSNDQYLTSLYPLARVSRTQSLGVTSLVLEMNSQVGFTLYTLARIILVIGALISLLFLGATHTAHKRLAERTRQANLDAVFAEREKAERTLNSITDAVILLDAEHRVVHLNPAARQLINRPTTNMIGCLLPELVRFKTLDDSNERFVLDEALENLVSGGESQFDIQPLDFSTSDSVFRLSLVRTHDAGDTTSGFIVMLRDISNERKLNQKLQYQANHDSLTGCTNRYYFEHRLQELMTDLPRTNRQHAICYMDLDQFKVINDTCGHTAGDLLLQELTENLRSLVRKGDVLSRLGGDEFGLIIVDAAPIDARRVANSLYEFFQNYVFTADDKSFAVRASIGVVFVDQNSGPLNEVLSAADIACYEAKDAGRNSVFFYSDSEERMEARSSELNWLPQLQKALTDDDFHIYAQPLAAISGDNSHHPVTHFEFLLRLVQQDGTVVTPWAFIQAAERYDLMRDIDRWVIKNAIRHVAMLPPEVARNFHFSINLSGQSAADSSVIDFIREQIEINQVPAELFWFELTETAAISHFSVANELFKSIRTLGAKVALDDFGSGLSSFGYLKNLPVDVLKIDGQFVRNIAEDKIDFEMVRAIHQVGRSMGIATVAEFVENEVGLQKLIDIGVDYAQGYHIGKPVPVEEAFAEFCMKKAA